MQAIMVFQDGLHSATFLYEECGDASRAVHLLRRCKQGTEPRYVGIPCKHNEVLCTHIGLRDTKAHHTCITNRYTLTLPLFCRELSCVYFSQGRPARRKRYSFRLGSVAISLLSSSQSTGSSRDRRSCYSARALLLPSTSVSWSGGIKVPAQPGLGTTA